MAFVYIDYDDCRAQGKKAAELAEKCGSISDILAKAGCSEETRAKALRLAKMLRDISGDVKKVSDELDQVDSTVLKELGVNG